jgi:hypothetical protein
LKKERQLKRRRLKRIAKLLTRRLTRSVRIALIQEAAGLESDVRELSATIKEYKADVRGGAQTIEEAEGMEAGVDADAATPTANDYIDMAAAQAELTPGLDDDIAAATSRADQAYRDYQGALNTGDPRRIAEAARNLKSAWEARENLLKQNTESMSQVAEQIAGLRKELEATRAFGERIQSTENFQLKKYLADVLGGQIVGYGVTGRSFTPGSGVEHAY